MHTQENLQELFALAYRDELTGLYNRRYLSRILAKSLDDSQGESPYGFLLMDIDYFKEINDNHGHANGDLVLSAVAALLRGLCPGDDTAIRYAGDEFVVFLPGADSDLALQRARRIVEQARGLRIPVAGNPDGLRLTLSVGAAAFPENGPGWQQIIEKADGALYAAKQQGRDRASLPPAEGEVLRGDDLSRIFPCPKYTGQEALLKEILRHLQAWQADAGGCTPRFLRVRGSRGAGKTRLLAELASALGSTHSVLLSFQGSEQAQGLCYGSLIRGLLDRAGSAAALRERVGPYLRAGDDTLWDAFFSGSASEKEPFSEDAARLFAAALLLGFGEGRPLVLLADDADLLDADTIRLFEDLAGTPDTSLKLFGILVTTTATRKASRSLTNSKAAEQGSGPASRPPTTDPDSLPAARVSGIPAAVLELAPLGEADVREAVKAILPTLRVPDSFSEALHRKSRGNPLFLEEALKLLIQTGSIVYHRSAWNWKGQGLEELPDALEPLLEARLAALDPEVRSLLVNASVLGGEIDPQLLPEIQKADEGYLIDLLEKARRFGVLDGDLGSTDGAFHFHTRTSHEVSYEQLPEHDRAALHLQIARLRESLEQGSDPLQLGSLLYHYEVAGQLRELEQIRSRLARTAPTTCVTLPNTFGARRGKPAFPEAEPLPPEGWARVLSVFHLLRAAVQTARLYPETSQAVARSCDRLLDGFQQVFQHTACLHLAEVDGTLLANGEAPACKGEEKRASDAFCRSLTEAGLKGISFARGLSLPEVREFLAVWLAVMNQTADAARSWESFEQKEGIEHIQINARVYVAVSDVNLPVAGFLSEPEAKADQPVEELTALLSSLQTKLASFHDRGAAASLGSQQSGEFLALLERMKSLLMPGSGTGALEIRPAPEVAPVSSLAKEQPPATPLQACRAKDEEDARGALADILSAEPQRETAGYEALSRLGRRAGPALYLELSRSDDDRTGRICARLLKDLDAGYAARIRADLDRNTEPPVKLRLLRHAVPLLDNADERRDILLAVLEREENALCLEALHQLETDFPDQACRLLLSILPARTDRAAHEICALLGRLRNPECVEPLLEHLARWRTMRNGYSPDFLESVCHALSHYPEERVVQDLGALLTATSRLPWRRCAPLALRRAALLALQRIGGDIAGSILKRCEADKDPWIRFRARTPARQPPAAPGRSPRLEKPPAGSGA